MKIKFGTSGWRSIIAEDFTFSNLRIVTQAIADYFRQEGLHNRPVVVGYDTRFLSEQFAQTSANVLAANGPGHNPDRSEDREVFDGARQRP